jgi:hypothetical protein
MSLGGLTSHTQVDVRALPTLSEADLSALGVDKLGPRLKMLTALRQLDPPRSPTAGRDVAGNDVGAVLSWLHQLDLAKCAPPLCFILSKCRY